MVNGNKRELAEMTDSTLSVYSGNEPVFSFFTSAEVALATLRLSLEDRCLFQSSDLASQMVTLRREFQHNGKFPEALQDILRITNQLQARVQNWEREVQNRERARLEMTGTRLQRLRIEVSQVRGKVQMTDRVLSKLQIVLHQLQAEEAEKLANATHSDAPTLGEAAEHEQKADAVPEGESCAAEQEAESAALLDTIRTRISERSLDGLLPLVERALLLRGDREDLQRLHDQLREREAMRTQECEQAFARAQSLLAEGKAREAYQVVQLLDATRFAPDQSSLREKLEQLFLTEKQIAAMVKDAKSGGKIDLIKVTAIFPKVVAYLQGNPQHPAMSKLRDDLSALLKRPD